MKENIILVLLLALTGIFGYDKYQKSQPKPKQEKLDKLTILAGSPNEQAKQLAMELLKIRTEMEKRHDSDAKNLKLLADTLNNHKRNFNLIETALNTQIKTIQRIKRMLVVYNKHIGHPLDAIQPKKKAKHIHK